MKHARRMVIGMGVFAVAFAIFARWPYLMLGIMVVIGVGAIFGICYAIGLMVSGEL